MPISEFYGQYQDEVIKNLIEAVHRNNMAHGWFDTDRTFGDDIALLHSEVTEAFEAYRSWGTQDPGAIPNALDDPKPEGVGSEFADILIRLFDACQRYDIDIARELRRKMEYNESRPYRHGGKKV